MDHADIHAAELARRANVSRATVSLWLNGTTQTLTGENLMRVAQAMGVNAHWLQTGEGEATSISEARESSAHYGLTLTNQERIMLENMRKLPTPLASELERFVASLSTMFKKTRRPKHG